jgi:hypothetical protein
MKFLARRSDGMVLSRFENSRLVFPIPSDTIIYDSPADISEAEMPNGTNLGGFVAAKIAAFQRLHPTYSGSHTYNGEFVSPDCDLSESLPITYGTIASGPGKTTILRPGAVLVTNPIASGSPNVTLCVRYNAFVMGSSHSHPTLRYYNYDENLGRVRTSLGCSDRHSDHGANSIRFRRRDRFHSFAGFSSGLRQCLDVSCVYIGLDDHHQRLPSCLISCSIVLKI